MSPVRMDKHTHGLPHGTRMGGQNLWRLIYLGVRHDVCIGRPGFYEDQTEEGAKVLWNVMKINLGAPKPIEISSYDADALLAANFSDIADG